ncbi:MAG: C-GCAxxG-C-C family protein [Clostridiaceae bacterium]|nr:C-GCAxxG-C-C family protein [Clostridiaceae bacterium]
MKKEVSISKVREDAEELFRKGEFYCSEAIVSAIRSNIDPDMPEQIIAMASGFPVGIGKSKCVCGAVSGGVMSLGYFLGRTKGSNPQDPKSVQTLEVANELQESFKNNHKVLCCKVLTHGMDMASGEHKSQCVSFTGEIAEKTAEIIVRELNLVNADNVVTTEG